MTTLEHDITTPSTDLMAPSGGPLIPPTAEAARMAMQTYQEISNALIGPNDLQTFRTKKGTSTFPKRSAFQKLANAYRVSTEIVSRQLTHDDDGQIIRCDVVVRATHPDGRYSEGDGACSRAEERFSGPRANTEKIDHDLPATAVTRAKNRAISDLVAFGAVSAEEIESTVESGGPAAAPPPHPGWAAPVSDISGVAESLVRLLQAAGVDHDRAAQGAIAVGEQTFKRCDESVPLCVWQAFNDIADVLTASEPEPDEPEATEPVAAS